MRAVRYFLQDFTDRHEGRHRNVPHEVRSIARRRGLS